MSTGTKKQKIFLRWLARGADRDRSLADQVIASIVPLFENAGFTWVVFRFDNERPQVNEIPLERKKMNDEVDFVSILFDKYRRPEFQLIASTKKIRKSGGWSWVKQGYLVWKQDDDVRYKLWGVRWWNLNRVKAEKDVVNTVLKLAPQLLDFLDHDVAGPNVRVS